jgi:hypothetical protein
LVLGLNLLVNPKTRKGAWNNQQTTSQKPVFKVRKILFLDYHILNFLQAQLISGKVSNQIFFWIFGKIHKIIRDFSKFGGG